MYWCVGCSNPLFTGLCAKPLIQSLISSFVQIFNLWSFFKSFFLVLKPFPVIFTELGQNASCCDLPEDVLNAKPNQHWLQNHSFHHWYQCNDIHRHFIAKYVHTDHTQWAVVIFAASPCPNPTCVSRSSSLSVVEDEKGKLLLLLTRSSPLVVTQNYQYFVFFVWKNWDLFQSGGCWGHGGWSPWRGGGGG